MSGNGWVKELISWSPVPPDKLVHCGIYFCLAGLMANFIGRWTRSKRILAPATFAVTMFYGLLDEGLQAFVPTRTPDFYDLVADAIGSFLGTTVFIGLRSGKARLRKDGDAYDQSWQEEQQPDSPF